MLTQEQGRGGTDTVHGWGGLQEDPQVQGPRGQRRPSPTP